MHRPPLPAAVAATIAPLVLAACVPFGTDPGAETVAEAVAAAVPEADGALAEFAVDGFEPVLIVKVWLPGADEASTDDLADVIDRTARAAWDSVPVEPVDISFGIVPGARPENPTMSRDEVVRYDDAYRRVFDRVGGVRLMVVPGEELERRYGTWAGS